MSSSILSRLQGYYIGYFNKQGFQVVENTYHYDVNHDIHILLSIKLTPDENLPVGKVCFRTSHKRSCSKPPIEGEAQVARSGYISPRYISGSLRYVDIERFSSFVFYREESPIIFLKYEESYRSSNPDPENPWAFDESEIKTYKMLLGRISSKTHINSNAYKVQTDDLLKRFSNIDKIHGKKKITNNRRDNIIFPVESDQDLTHISTNSEMSSRTNDIRTNLMNELASKQNKAIVIDESLRHSEVTPENYGFESIREIEAQVKNFQLHNDNALLESLYNHVYEKYLKWSSSKKKKIEATTTNNSFVLKDRSSSFISNPSNNQAQNPNKQNTDKSLMQKNDDQNMFLKSSMGLVYFGYLIFISLLFIVLLAGTITATALTYGNIAFYILLSLSVIILFLGIILIVFLLSKRNFLFLLDDDAEVVLVKSGWAICYSLMIFTDAIPYDEIDTWDLRKKFIVAGNKINFSGYALFLVMKNGKSVQCTTPLTIYSQQHALKERLRIHISHFV
mmetsp:Transcript_13912/g.21051  ORF Transcript_13912/g.21051 Transcript_13912/m.21051 type:complete len:507 (-) Transcript_13912:42-1562(-)